MVPILVMKISFPSRLRSYAFLDQCFSIINRMESEGSTTGAAAITRRVLDDLPNLLSLAVFLSATALLFRSLEFALIVTASLGFHELGHAAALAFSGLDWRISFGLAGAWTWSSSAQRQQLTHLRNAFIHLAGPFFSLLLALLALAINTLWRPADSHLLLLANFSAQVGFLNLIPLGGLTDGGKIVRRLAATYKVGPVRIWAVLLPMLVSALMLFVYALLAPPTPAPLLSLLLIGLWMSGSLVIELRPFRHPSQPNHLPASSAPARITPAQGYLLVTAMWALLALALLISAATPFWLAPRYLLGSLRNAFDVLSFLTRSVL